MTFPLDAYEGWSEDKLKRKCRELVHACTGKDMLICNLVLLGGLENMPKYMADEVRKILSLYTDGSDDESQRGEG